MNRIKICVDLTEDEADAAQTLRRYAFDIADMYGYKFSDGGYSLMTLIDKIDDKVRDAIK